MIIIKYWTCKKKIFEPIEYRNVHVKITFYYLRFLSIYVHLSIRLSIWMKICISFKNCLNSFFKELLTKQLSYYPHVTAKCIREVVVIDVALTNQRSLINLMTLLSCERAMRGMQWKLCYLFQELIKRIRN